MAGYEEPRRVEHICTRADVNQSAMQFDPTQQGADDIQQWMNFYDANIIMQWTGHVGDNKTEPVKGFLIMHHGKTGLQMEAFPGDWIIKSSRDTFYTMRAEDFDEIFVRLH